MSRIIKLQFSRGVDDRIAGEPAEVKAIDVQTDMPVAALPVKEMGRWLEKEGFQWRYGSNGVWESAA